MLQMLKLCLFIINILYANAFLNHKIRNNIQLNMALKYDPNTFIKVSIKRPLGIDLEEVEANGESGVYISDLAVDGNAAKTGKLRKGLFLMEANNVDVKNKDFDSIIKILSSVSEGKLVELIFVDPNSVFKGPAILNVKLPVSFDASTGEEIVKTTQIKCLKGQNLRNVLLDSKIDVYDMKSKLTNCGGGGQCATCVVRLDIPENDWSPVPKFETLRLKKYDSDCRLSCNVIIEGDCSVEVRPKPKSDSKLMPKSIF